VGQWRRERQHIRRDDRLFTEILVPLNGTEYGWFALEEAILVARREEARLHGLHVVPTENQLMSEEAQKVQTEFNQRCQQAGVSGELVLAIGDVAAQICSRARWTDLVITTLSYPPGDQPFSRLSSGFRDLIQRCPRPILAVPLTVTPLNQALLAYDGSPKAKEALYVATYLACQWNISLTAVSVVENGNASSATLDQAREYLEDHGVEASYLIEQGSFAERILAVSEEQGSDLLIMGGYGFNPVLELVLGSGVDQVLRESQKPMLICR
jgi:nucleotide-binding universal stress UspA family protein